MWEGVCGGHSASEDEVDNGYSDYKHTGNCWLESWTVWSCGRSSDCIGFLQRLIIPMHRRVVLLRKKRISHREPLLGLLRGIWLSRKILRGRKRLSMIPIEDYIQGLAVKPKKKQKKKKEKRKNAAGKQRCANN